MTATDTSIDMTVRDLIVSVVGEAEASNISLDTVAYRQAGALDVGDQAWDGCLTVLPDDTVRVWAQGDIAKTQHVPGAWGHFDSKATHHGYDDGWCICGARAIAVSNLANGGHRYVCEESDATLGRQ